MTDTGKRIKDRRKQLGISADTLAEALNVSRSTIFRYENGEIEKVPGKSLTIIAKKLRTTPAYLMGWEDNLEEDTDFIVEMLKDAIMIAHIKKLVQLKEEDKKSVYDMIDFLAGKETEHQ